MTPSGQETSGIGSTRELPAVHGYESLPAAVRREEQAADAAISGNPEARMIYRTPYWCWATCEGCGVRFACLETVPHEPGDKMLGYCSGSGCNSKSRYCIFVRRLTAAEIAERSRVR